MERNELTDKEKEILYYVRKNPGSTKQSVVNYSRSIGLCARRTVYKNLRSLTEDYKMIVVRQDDLNSQTHHLYINEDDLLTSTIIGIEDFKNAFFILLGKAKRKYKELESEAKRHEIDWDIQRKLYQLEYSLSSSLFGIYKYFINLHILFALLKWPEITTDKEVLNGLNTAFFINAQEIQSNISEVLSIVIRPSNHRKELIELMVSHPPTLKVSYFSGMLSTFRSLELDKEFEPIMNYLWKAGFDFIDFEGERKKSSLKDWKKVFRRH